MPFFRARKSPAARPASDLTKHKHINNKLHSGEGGFPSQVSDLQSEMSRLHQQLASVQNKLNNVQKQKEEEESQRSQQTFSTRGTTPTPPSVTKMRRSTPAPMMTMKDISPPSRDPNATVPDGNDDRLLPISQIFVPYATAAVHEGTTEEQSPCGTNPSFTPSVGASTGGPIKVVKRVKKRSRMLPKGSNGRRTAANTGVPTSTVSCGSRSSAAVPSTTSKQRKYRTVKKKPVFSPSDMLPTTSNTSPAMQRVLGHSTTPATVKNTAILESKDSKNQTRWPPPKMAKETTNCTTVNVSVLRLIVGRKELRVEKPAKKVPHIAIDTIQSRNPAGKGTDGPRTAPVSAGSSRPSNNGLSNCCSEEAIRPKPASMAPPVGGGGNALLMAQIRKQNLNLKPVESVPAPATNAANHQSARIGSSGGGMLAAIQAGVALKRVEAPTRGSKRTSASSTQSPTSTLLAKLQERKKEYMRRSQERHMECTAQNEW